MRTQKCMPIVGLCLILLTLAAAPAEAQTRTTPAWLDGNDDFMHADGDRDGVISREEFDALVATRFMQADFDHNGVLTRRESEAFNCAGIPVCGYDVLYEADGNKNVAIDADEMAGYAGHAFRSADRDIDGSISLEEAQAWYPN